MATDLLHARLLELLHYDTVTGAFTWRVDRGRNKTAGTPAGYLRPDGYVGISVDNRRYLAQRLARFYVTGAWPENQVDHRDLKRSNNIFSNLRDATNKQNNENRRIQANTASGVMGVSWFPQRQKWQVGIKHHGVRKNLGYFSDLIDAVAVRLRAERELFTYSPRVQQ